LCEQHRGKIALHREAELVDYILASAQGKLDSQIHCTVACELYECHMFHACPEVSFSFILGNYDVAQSAESDLKV
jgi:hypothetical protein